MIKIHSEYGFIAKGHHRIAEINNQHCSCSCKKCINNILNNCYKVTENEKQEVEAAIKELEEALQGNDLELIRTKKDALLTAAQGVATKAYQKAQGAANPSESGTQNDDGTINADFEDISDDKK